LTTGALYQGLLWGLVPVALTLLLGRFFCGWVCPFGTLHHAAGHFAHRKKKSAEKITLNRYSPYQSTKYFILIIFLAMAFFPFGGGLHTGLLDPVPLFTRTVNLVLIPIVDRPFRAVTQGAHFFEGGLIVLVLFIVLVLLNTIRPRFFCRFLCPLGALMGILGRFAVLRFGQNGTKCRDCGLCEQACEGACEPAGYIRQGECVLCGNCMNDCPHETISYQTAKSTAGEITGAGISRRAFLTTLGSGVFLIPAVRLAGNTSRNWDHEIIRPPGSLKEEEFLARCLKCGQCARICPTGVIQPGSLDRGIENLWTPNLNFRVGTSGCQFNCVACGSICPTAAIRPITLDEKHGRNGYKKTGPIRIGTAFVDRSRCLPWAMDLPCIVCQENCPVSPKAIHTDDCFTAIGDGKLEVEKITGSSIILKKRAMVPGKFSTGDYYAVINNRRYRIASNDAEQIVVAGKLHEMSVHEITIDIRLQRPYIDISKCTGCGICEHECPVQGLKAIRITAEGETRSPEKRIILRKKIL